MSMGPPPVVVYRLFDKAGRLLYVGVTVDIGMRFAEHRAKKEWWGEVSEIRLTHYETRADALAAESGAILTESPVYNIVHSTTRAMTKPGANRTTTTPDPTDSLAVVAAAHWAACAEAEAARANLHGEILAALAEGHKQVEIARVTGYTRERLRQIARQR